MLATASLLLLVIKAAKQESVSNPADRRGVPGPRCLFESDSARDARAGHVREAPQWRDVSTAEIHRFLTEWR
jgi:hypothetical protein